MMVFIVVGEGEYLGYISGGDWSLTTHCASDVGGRRPPVLYSLLDRETS